MTIPDMSNAGSPADSAAAACAAPPVAGWFPATVGQWALALRAEAPGHSFNVSAAFLVPPRVQPGDLRTASRAVAARHQALAVDFSVGADGCWQVPWRRTGEIEWCEVQVAADDVRTCTTAIARDAASRPFSPGSDRRLRISAVCVAGSVRGLVVDADHLVLDATALRVIMAETAHVLAGGDLPPTDHERYVAFHHDQHRWLGSPSAQRRIAWWERELDGLGPQPTLALPGGDQPVDPAIPSRRVSLPLPGETWRRLCEAHATPRQPSAGQLWNATVALCLHRMTGQPTVTTRMAVPNRQGRELADLVAWTANTVVLRSDAGRARTVGEMLEATQRRMMGAFRNSAVPRHELVRRMLPGAFGKPRDYVAVFVSIDPRFTLHGRSGGGLHLESLPSGGPTLHGVRAQLLAPGNGGVVDIAVDENLFPGEQLHRFAADLVGTLQQVTSRPHTPVRTSTPE